MSDELKPCPFCGSPAKQISMGAPGVTCPNGCCYIIGGTREKVNARWNIRPNESALQVRNAELEKIIDKFAEAGTDVYHRVRAEFYEDASVRADWRELMHTYRKDWVI